MTSSARSVVHLSTVHHGFDNRIRNKECRALTRAGIDTTLVITGDSSTQADGLKVQGLPQQTSRVGRLLGGQVNAWRALSRLKPKLVQVHDPELIPLAWLYARSHRVDGARVRAIYDAHEDLVKQIATKPYLNRFAKPVGRFAARLLMGLADRGMDAVVAATEDVAAAFPVARRTGRAVVVRNFPWLSDFASTGQDTDPISTQVPGRVVYAGDLSEERKLSFMIDMVRRARERVPSAHLVLAGRPLGSAKQTLARAVDGEIVQHWGLLAPAELPDFIRSGQVGVIMLEALPNYLNSWPTKLFEYMASGVAFVASDFPIWRQRFGTCAAGVFTDSENLEGATDDLVALLGDAQRCRELGENGQRWVAGGFDFESQAVALVELTQRLLAR